MLGINPHFQPIVDTWTNEVVGYEATIKGESNQNARELFRKAFTDGTTIELDQKARSLAIKEGMKLLTSNQKLFVNISPQSVTECPHTEWWGMDIEDVPMNRIVLELTESAPINGKKFKRDIHHFREKGLQLALDDFGKGYSNYEVLATSGNFSFLKLDKIFVTNCAKSRYQTITKHLIRMSQDFQGSQQYELKVIAEGIEHEWQKDIMHQLGVRYMQGFYFGYPRPLEDYLIHKN